MKVLVATPAYAGLVTTDYMISFLESAALAIIEGIHLQLVLIKNEALISRGRNSCASLFYHGDYDKLMFIDADISWRWDQLRRILRSEQPIVGGTYCMKAYPLRLNFNPLEPHLHYFEDGRERSVSQFLKFREEADSNGEVPVMHVPTGFMCISRPIITSLINSGEVSSYTEIHPITNRVEKQWDLFPCPVKEERYMSEDWGFCELAKQHGFHVTLNTECVVGHTGSHTFSAGV